MAGRNNFFVLLVLLMNLAMTAMGQGFYTIIDDDIMSKEAVSSVKRVADKYGIKIVYAATVKGLQNKEMADLLLEYQKEGHQIIDHGWTHSPDVWRNPKWDVIQGELDKSNALLDSLGFKDHDYFVYPFGKYSAETQNRIIPKIRERYKMAFNARGHYCDLKDFNRYYIPRFADRWHNNMWAVKWWIRRANEKSAWVVFLNHSGKPRDYKEEYLEEIVAYCQSLGMQNLTVAQAYQKFGKLKVDKQAQDYSIWDDITDVLFLHIVWIMCAIALFLLIVIGIYKYKNLK